MSCRVTCPACGARRPADWESTLEAEIRCPACGHTGPPVDFAPTAAHLAYQPAEGFYPGLPVPRWAAVAVVALSLLGAIGLDLYGAPPPPSAAERRQVAEAIAFARLTTRQWHSWARHDPRRLNQNPPPSKTDPDLEAVVDRHGHLAGLLIKVGDAVSTQVAEGLADETQRYYFQQTPAAPDEITFIVRATRSGPDLLKKTYRRPAR